METQLERKISEMSGGDHACLIYDSIQSQMAAVLPFVKSGLDRNEACLYIAHDRTLEEIKQIFNGYGINVEKEINRGALIFPENNMPGGKFVPAEMVGSLINFTQESLKKGFKGFRGVGEMSWVLGNECGCDLLIEYEGLLNEKFSTHLTGMCQYNRNRFKSEMIRDILRTHSVVVVGDAVCRNLYCESEPASRGKISNDHGVSWMLENLMKFHSLEQKLRDLIRVRDDFVSIASHELRTPITSLKMKNDLALKSLLGGHFFAEDEQEKMLTFKAKQIKRLESLVDSILDVSLISRGKLTLAVQEMDWVEEVSACVKNFKTLYPAIELEYLHPKKLKGVADPIRIGQVVNNLLSNAKKYGEDKPLCVQILHTNDNVILSVQDQGMGISKENQMRIFELYERAISYNNITGLGLGLFIVDQIVKAHGGTISVTSELGKGSTFTVTVPLVKTDQ